MTENDAQAEPVNPPKPAAVEPPDAGHIPMTEEFDRAKWTLPPPKSVAIGLLVFAFIAAVVMFLARGKPAASGSVDNVIAVTMPDNNVMVAINLTVTNAMPTKSLWIRSMKARLTKPDGQEVTDEAASIADFDRYFQAFPELKQNAIEPLKPETKLTPGASTRGRIIVSFPVDKPTFEQRKGLAVIVDPYDQPPVIIASK